jgi:hypothetical protein
LKVPIRKRPREAEDEDASARLSDGLKTCRSVLAHYKALLTADQPGNDDPDECDPAETHSADSPAA